jgi:putative inorganic carbon (HCO3(-)) transporter
MIGAPPVPVLPAGAWRLPAAPVRTPSVAFGLFLLLTGVLWVRPTEVIPALDGMPVFQGVILACLAVTLPWVLPQLRPGALAANPITACVVGLGLAVPLSYLSHGLVGEAAATAFEFLKVVAYYLLLVAVVDSPRRLRLAVGWVLVFLAIQSGLALAHFHGLVDIPSMAPVYDQMVNKETGETTRVARMCGVGLFGNPNDLARILTVGIVLTLYLIREMPAALAPLLAGLVGVFGYAMTETHSRGGLVGLVVTLGVLAQVQWGGVRTALLGVVAAAGLVVVGPTGRQTDLGTDEGTGQQRIQLWLEGFSALREAPVFGTGAGRYEELTGLGAHNSFVESFVDLGLVGGTLFVAATFLSVALPYRTGPTGGSRLPRELVRIRPFLVAAVAGYAAGMLTSSRNYMMPTYALFGLAAAYHGLVTSADRGAPRLDRRMAGRLVFVSGAVLAALYAFAQMSVRWK